MKRDDKVTTRAVCVWQHIREFFFFASTVLAPLYPPLSLVDSLFFLFLSSYLTAHFSIIALQSARTRLYTHAESLIFSCPWEGRVLALLSSTNSFPLPNKKLTERDLQTNRNISTPQRTKQGCGLHFFVSFRVLNRFRDWLSLSSSLYHYY